MQRDGVTEAECSCLTNATLAIEQLCRARGAFVDEDAHSGMGGLQIRRNADSRQLLRSAWPIERMTVFLMAFSRPSLSPICSATCTRCTT